MNTIPSVSSAGKPLNLAGALNMTIFSDASLCPKSKAAGWGAWAIRDGWKRGRFLGGPFRRPEIQNSTHAELCGIASAIHALSLAGELRCIASITIQCDAVNALGALVRVGVRPTKKRLTSAHIPRRLNVDPIEQEAVSHILNATEGIRLYVRHVKGHQSGDGRQWVNAQCDAEAKRHMNARRREISQQVPA